jgi:hypothetical protein
MKLASGFCLCVLCGWVTMGAQVIPASNCSCGVASSGTVNRNLLSAAPGAASQPASETTSRPDSDEVAKQIDETEEALNAMKRPMDTVEEKTAAQIRTYIVHAREALKDDDLDGASTMSMKARALLLELGKECRLHSGPKSRLRTI